ncbi:MAG: zinc-binding alcohol dehydrogenase family protein [Rubrivivax sp.]
MKAAIVTSFDQAPRCGDADAPVPQGPAEMRVDVLAAGLHPLTRARAAGAHYAGSGVLPFVAGADGVGRGSDGKLRYFVQSPGRAGTMAEQTVIELDHSIELPDACDPATVAAAMNPAMASWLALRCRVPLGPGRKLLILGATGSAGRMAVQITRHLGASQVIAAGRDERRLAGLRALGATETVALADPRLGECAREVDVVLDFVWGETAVRVMEAVLRARADRSRPLTWIHVGSMAGPAAPIPGALLRAANLQIVGSGHGAVPEREILQALPALAAEIARGSFRIDVKALPLSEVERAWPAAAGAGAGERIVFTP